MSRLDAKAIGERLTARFSETIAAVQLDGPSPWALVQATAIDDVALYCRDDDALRFDNLMCLSGVDYPKDTPPRMEVVYHLFSYEHRHSFALKVHLPRESPALPSVESVWPAATWHEREAYDLLGIAFIGHSDLRRILLPDDWVGHPLRKDWQDPDYYNGMRVKPTPQMAERAMGGEQIGVGPFDFTPPNRHVG